MKKLNLQLGSIKEMLSKEQMKKVLGGSEYDDECEDGYFLCTCTGADGNTVTSCESSTDDCMNLC